MTASTYFFFFVTNKWLLSCLRIVTIFLYTFLLYTRKCNLFLRLTLGLSLYAHYSKQRLFPRFLITLIFTIKTDTHSTACACPQSTSINTARRRRGRARARVQHFECRGGGIIFGRFHSGTVSRTPKILEITPLNNNATIQPRYI